MKFLIYAVLIVLAVQSVTHCAAVRTSATQIRVARTKRLDEAEGQ